ncbi:serine hydrolase [Streptomyces sp. XD-27]|uniref:serine hydrolase domain-containing protein n=1 Tax=Streptomyces sp. XD-27 TaxID=3062779 RepID=UPI0026F457C2|nr:serine hydrolase domain-containing protein [Streptomyces sp. XD-27]WKX73940.1 serine hydrolase domain-containing protein [Streptomyces sp. XD-27]
MSRNGPLDADEIARRVRKSAEEHGFSGAVVVARAGEPVFADAFGWASRAWRIPNTVGTRFRVASVSKMFTAVAVLRLVEQGRVGPADRLAPLLGARGAWLPPEVTVSHALTMTSGIADWFDEGGDWAAEWAALTAAHPLYLLRDNADYLPLFAGKEPLFAPGERHRYNGAGYILLGLLLESLTGRPYADVIHDQVFARAAMADSGFVALDEVVPGVAEGHLPPEEAADGRRTGWRRNVYSATPAAAADGGATCTADDLVGFARALRSGRLLGADMTRRALTPQVLERAEKVRGYTWKYGYGVMFLLDDDGTVVRWGHTGEEDGVSARLYHYPRLDADVAILGNVSGCAGALGWDLHDALTG